MLERFVPGFPLENLEGVNDFREQMNRLFSDLISRNLGDLFSGNYPLVDLLEQKDKYIVRVEIPGVKKEDVKVAVQDGMLIIQGKRVQPELPEGADVLRNEIIYGEFSRSIILPPKADLDKISARYVDGILEISIEKKEEEKSKEIAIEVK